MTRRERSGAQWMKRGLDGVAHMKFEDARSQFRPATPYTLHSASAKARELHPGAFCKVAQDSARAHRFQVLVEEAVSPVFHNAHFFNEWRRRDVYLVASGPDWVTALSRFHDWMEEHHGNEETEG